MATKQTDASSAREAGRAEVARLVQYFATNRASFMADGRKEAQVRLSLIDPLFTALGWDVANTRLVAPQYREVIPEDSVDVEGRQRAPDYAFRVGTLTKFYAEAKKCTVAIATDMASAHQVRRYGWSGKTPLAVLTNFAELAVYDCTARPSATDKASNSRILHLKCEEYADRWDELWDLLSRDALWSGKFDEFAASKSKRGTALVDTEFLKEIERWRELLAKNIAARTKGISVDDLNAIVQLTIDRIIFLRMAEDRGLEAQGQLLKLSQGTGIYTRFLEDICFRADVKYNSGLFHLRGYDGQIEEEDGLSDTVSIDDRVLKDILQSLYFEHGSPYDFGVLPVEILGTVYERFLGRVITLQAARRVNIEEKPEVRRAKGVYYTPVYVVDYIVRETVGRQIEGLSPKALQGSPKTPPFRVLDLSCGSGSFLLGAYRYLLNHYLEWYVSNSPARYKKAVLKNPRSQQWQLTIEEKKKILLTHIYGVDIDRQAVEVTKLSLLLKALEGENEITLSPQLQLFGERALPDLAANIRCGNSIIENDFFDENLLADPEEIRRINPFDWHHEFPWLAKEGGWSCIIGNPPYVQIENIPRDQRGYFTSTYGSAGSLGKRYDLYQIFTLKGMNLLREGGRLGFILPNTFLSGHSYGMLRRRLVGEACVESVVDLPQGVFHGVTVDNVLLFARREAKEKVRSQHPIQVRRLNPKSLKTRLLTEDWDASFELPQGPVLADEAAVINIHADPTVAKLLAKISVRTIKLGDVTESSQGIIIYRTEEDAARSEFTGRTKKAGWKRLLRGTNIGRYETLWEGEYLHYGRWLWSPRDEKFFAEPKILLQAMRNKSLVRRLVATIDTEQHYNAHNLANIIAKQDGEYSLYYLLGILNSTLINFWYKRHFPNVNINPSDFRRIPVRRIENDRERALAAELIARVKQLLDNRAKHNKDTSQSGRAALERQAAVLDTKIDDLVYQLYGISSADRKLVLGDA